MGVVHRAIDRETGETVAVKLLHALYADEPAYRERFAREVELARRIDSPNVVRVLGYGIREGLPYVALEYVEGRSLRELIAEHGPYAWAEARALLAQIASGLAAAHDAGVVHRDVKPSNILVTAEGLAKLTDFGIATALDLTKLTGTSTLLGTPTYMAPEGPLDARSDLYSLGIVAYELLTGLPPFEGDSHQAVILAHVRTAPDLARLPAAARGLVGSLLAKDPGRRPRSARHVLASLAPAATTVSSRPTVRLRARPPARAAAGSLAALAVLAAAVVMVAPGIWPGPAATASPAPSADASEAGLVSRSPIASRHPAEAPTITGSLSTPSTSPAPDASSSLPASGPPTELPTSAASSAPQRDVSAPATPASVRVSLTSATSVEITWKDRADDESGFQIVDTTFWDGYRPTITTEVARNRTSAAISELSVGRMHCFFVRAVNGAGSSQDARATPDCIRTPGPAPDPTLVAAHVVNGACGDLVCVEVTVSPNGCERVDDNNYCNAAVLLDGQLGPNRTRTMINATEFTFVVWIPPGHHCFSVAWQVGSVSEGTARLVSEPSAGICLDL
jgi:serine/threonine-protein kinase